MTKLANSGLSAHLYLIKPHVLHCPVDQKSEKEKECMKRLFSVIFCDEMAKTFLIEFEGHLRKSDLFRHKAKQAIAVAYARARRFERDINGALSLNNSYSYCDMITYIEDVIRPQFQKLKGIVLRIVAPRFALNPDKLSTAPEKLLKRAEIAAECECVRIMCEIANDETQKAVEEYKDFQGGVLNGLKLQGMDVLSREMTRCMNSILNNFDTSKDLSVIMCRSKMQKTMIDAQSYHAAIKQTDVPDDLI